MATIHKAISTRMCVSLVVAILFAAPAAPAADPAHLAKEAARLNFDKIAFVTRYTYSANHYYTEYINSRWTPGGNLCILDLKTGQVKHLRVRFGGHLT